jgi:ATP-binding cassette subfamily B protein
MNEPQATKSLVKLVFSQKGYVPIIIFIIGNLFAWNLPSLFIAKVINEVSSSGSIEAKDLLKYAYAVSGAILFGEMLARVSAHLQRRIVQRKISQLYLESFDSLLNKSMAFFGDTFSGGIATKVYRYVSGFENFARVCYFQFGIAISNLIFAVVVLGKSNPLAILVYVGISTAAIVTLKRAYATRAKKSYKVSKSTSEVSAQMMDAFTNIGVVKSLATQDFENKKFKESVDEFEKNAIDYWDYSNKYLAFPLSIYISLNYGLALFFAIYARSWGANPEVVYLTATLFFNLTLQFWDFSRIYQDLQGHIAAAKEGLELLNAESNDVYALQKTKEVNFTNHDIELKNVQFSYRQDGTDQKNIVFKDFNLKIKDGEKVGIVGHSGVGKSTLIKMLLGFENVDKDQIFIGGNDIATTRDRDLKKIMGYVPQDISLFHRSIYKNITYGLENIEEERFKDAVKKSYVDEFVDELPEKYDTLVGERGIKLSGGQRQRISIARVLLQDFKILVLDEATSALDSKSERFIQDSLEDLMKDKTVVAVAHRLSTIAHLDRIIVLDKGAVVETGSHKELLKNGSIYKDLWEHQSGGYIG